MSDFNFNEPSNGFCAEEEQQESHICEECRALEGENEKLKKELEEAAILINLAGYKEWKRGNDFYTRCVNFLIRNGYKYGYIK